MQLFYVASVFCICETFVLVLRCICILYLLNLCTCPALYLCFVFVEPACLSCVVFVKKMCTSPTLFLYFVILEPTRLSCIVFVFCVCGTCVLVLATSPQLVNASPTTDPNSLSEGQQLLRSALFWEQLIPQNPLKSVSKSSSNTQAKFIRSPPWLASTTWSFPGSWAGPLAKSWENIPPPSQFLYLNFVFVCILKQWWIFVFVFCILKPGRSSPWPSPPSSPRSTCSTCPASSWSP